MAKVLIGDGGVDQTIVLVNESNNGVVNVLPVEPDQVPSLSDHHYSSQPRKRVYDQVDPSLLCPEIHAGDVLSSLSLFRVLSLKFFSFLF